LNETLPNNKVIERVSSTVDVQLGVSLINILNSISVSTSFEDFFKSVTKLILDEVNNISGVFYYLVDREIEIIQCLGKLNSSLQFTARNENEDDVEIIQDLNRGILGATVESGVPMIISNQQMERFDENEICIPVIFENETTGLIRVVKQTAQHFTEEEQQKLVYIACTLGGFIKSKLLTQQLQRTDSTNGISAKTY